VQRGSKAAQVLGGHSIKEALLAIGIAMLAGAIAGRSLMLAWACVVAGGAAIAAGVLKQRSLAWFICLFVCLPVFDPQDGVAGGTQIPLEAISGLALLAVAVPSIWTLLSQRRSRSWRPSLVVWAAVLTLLVMVSVLRAGLHAMLDIVPSGAFVGAATYLVAQRLSDLRAWPAAASAALAVLFAVGATRVHADPGGRLGYFVGYPILFAALIVALLPLALVWAHARSRWLTIALLAAASASLVLSETRSAWLAVAVALVVWLALLARAHRTRLLVGGLICSGLCVIGIAAIGPLAEVVHSRLTSQELQGLSKTHREGMYGYAWARLKAAPMLGAQFPGASKQAIQERTGLDAADNGFLALAEDLGLLGLALGVVPVFVALCVIVRAWRNRRWRPEVLAVALGALGLGIVGVFFDIFYWPQSSLLLYAFAGILTAVRYE
jgi:hypothetical protein